MASTYEPIATTTLGSASNSVTFSSIPGTYTDLRLIGVVRGNTTNATYVQLRFNGSSTALYSATDLAGDGSAAYSQRVTGDSYILVDRDGMPKSNNTADIYGMFTTDIFYYAGSTYKTCLSTVSSDKNGSGFSVAAVGLWRNTAAITSLTIYADGSNLAQYTAGSTFTLYGIKAA